MTFPIQTHILNLDVDSLQESLNTLNEPSFRTKQIWNGIYKNLFLDWNEFSTLPKTLRFNLSNLYSINSFTIQNTLITSDGNTQKVLFLLFDEKPIESVLIRSGRRHTLCLSTQSGCAIGCTFCATGKMGLLRNLTTGEIIEQVLFFKRFLQSSDKQLTNIVFMGMGEPFNNYKEVIRSIRILNDKYGLDFGSRRITLSTIGIIPQINQFAADLPQVNLAISLHAPNDELRSKLIPINRSYPLADLLHACKDYIDKTNRRISFEYVLLENFNDDSSQAKELVSLISGLLCHVNLIPFNPIDHSDFKPSQYKKILLFEKILLDKGISTTIRKSQGAQIKAGCGQLAGHS